MVSEIKNSFSKVKAGNYQDGGSRSKLEFSANKKKIETSIKNSVASKQNSASVFTKSEVKSKTTPSSSKTITKTTRTTTRVREKKVFTLAGQKYDPPEEREPLRIFYESLSKQIPSSEMAEFWMMEHGLLSPEKSKKAYEKKQRRQKELRTGTPIKSPKPPIRPESSQKQQQSSKNGDFKAKRKIVSDSDEDEDDFILSPKRRKM